MNDLKEAAGQKWRPNPESCLSWSEPKALVKDRVYLIQYNITMQGTVKFFNEAKGFGFIKQNDNGEEIFVHSSGLVDTIRENDVVEYQVERGKKGMNAVNVTVLK